ncbi:hypothetical protein scyTo_0020283 [Scyliorhinus torazame]|uniref:SAM domain-containing protein n=1 Tax=Scyliorhinus torazame TaxID=75743 RepID=A0A401PP56_SCYTO|nr:hypothetical protein [Scyliorhinus torazame]
MGASVRGEVTVPDCSLLSLGVPEEEKQFLVPPSFKFARSLSVPSADDIPPPPTTAPPDPPFSLPQPRSGPPPPPLATAAPSSARSTFNPGGTGDAKIYASLRHDLPEPPVKGDAKEPRQKREKIVVYRQDSDQLADERARLTAGGSSSSSAASQPNARGRRGPAAENRYGNPTARVVNTAMYVPAKPVRRKGLLVKQSKVEDELQQQQQQQQDKTCSIPIPTIIIKAPSTSSSGRSSQGSSMEAEAVTEPLQARESLDFTSQFGAAIVGAARRDRERYMEARRKSAIFLSTDVAEEEPESPSRLTHSKSIDEGMFNNAETFMNIMVSAGRGAPLSYAGDRGYVYETKHGKQPGPASSAFNSLSSTFGQRGGIAGTFIHPLTGKVLDPESPLALALAARERSLKEQPRSDASGAGKGPAEATSGTTGPKPRGAAGAGALTGQRKEAGDARASGRPPLRPQKTEELNAQSQEATRNWPPGAEGEGQAELRMSGTSWNRSSDTTGPPTASKPVIPRHRIADDSVLGASVQKPPPGSTFQNWPKTPQHSPKPPKTVEFDIKPAMRRAPSPSTPHAAEHRANQGTPRPSSLPILPSAGTAHSALPAGYDVHSAPTSAGNSYASFPAAGRAHSPTTSFQSPPPMPPDKPFAAKPLAFWTKFDVADWLEYLHLGEHKEHFLENEIDGSHLPSLQKEDYVDLGVTRVGHRMNIERALKRLLER